MELLERYICAELESVLLGERPERLYLLRRVYEREGATDLQEVQCYREVRMLGVRETEAHSALLEALRYGVEAEAEAPDIPLACELQVVYPVTTLRAVLQLGGESRSVEVCAEGFLCLEEACRGGGEEV